MCEPVSNCGNRNAKKNFGNSKIMLTHISPVSHFYSPWKRQKTKGFQKVYQKDCYADYGIKILSSLSAFDFVWPLKKLDIRAKTKQHSSLFLTLCTAKLFLTTVTGERSLAASDFFKNFRIFKTLFLRGLILIRT